MSGDSGDGGRGGVLGGSTASFAPRAVAHPSISAALTQRMDIKVLVFSVTFKRIVSAQHSIATALTRSP